MGEIFLENASMCGIVAACAQRDVAQILLAGLTRLEYRGYDSAGLAVLDEQQTITRLRRVGKVAQLADALRQTPLSGKVGIAHTRWATHGEPTESNAHPHFSDHGLALVHNGIIENYLELKTALDAQGIRFESETDSEVIVHAIALAWRETGDLLVAVQQTVSCLQGAFSLAVIAQGESRIIGVRRHSPLVIGLGIGEHFLASDPLALLPVTHDFIYLEEGDVVDLRADGFTLYNPAGEVVSRRHERLVQEYDAADRGTYRHFMQKEIHEQPQAVRATLLGCVDDHGVSDQAFGIGATAIFDDIEHVQIVACGTSYHAGLVARYWLEGLAKVSCDVEVASEYRYRDSVTRPNTLFVTLSQSGETADTLAALRKAKSAAACRGYLSICNVAASSLARAADLVFITQAGREIGVASTKAFVTQLVAMMLLTLALGRRRGLSSTQEKSLIASLQRLPNDLEHVLRLEPEIKKLSKRFADKQHALFLGRGALYPIALEGSLKLKEISYIHAEAYPAGELKHGPLALVDKNMPVVAVVPNDRLLEKLLSNLQEVQARGGELVIFSGQNAMGLADHQLVCTVPSTDEWLAPIIYTLPLQLLSYHVAVLKGTDVDQPRNLAKSVTVE